jgi:hypothetical protein
LSTVRSIFNRLLCSQEPAIRYQARLILGAESNSSEMAELRRQISGGPTSTALLAGRNADGTLPCSAYAKWHGPHWVLTMQAELEYPPGDEGLRPMFDQAMDWVMARRQCDMRVQTPVRCCASIEGNAIWYSLKLGFADERTDRLAERILAVQWPDGGWNCDRSATGKVSSFNESAIPMRALALYAAVRDCAEARAAVERASEVFLCRRLFRRRSNGNVMDHRFTKIHYPAYWHYDFLFGLKVLAETGFIGEPQCSDALDLLEGKRLPDGGFPAEASYSQKSDKSTVDWGPGGKTRSNEFATVDALYVLRMADRFTTA